jgi:hypothetical protein
MKGQSRPLGPPRSKNGRSAAGHRAFHLNHQLADRRLNQPENRQLIAQRQVALASLGFAYVEKVLLRRLATDGRCR